MAFVTHFVAMMLGATVAITAYAFIIVGSDSDIDRTGNHDDDQ